LAFKYFTVDMSVQQTGDILDKAISPRKFYHHDQQGGVDWRVSRSGYQTKITLDESVDESVITYLLLKSQYATIVT
jgi:hypothetical protein